MSALKAFSASMSKRVLSLIRLDYLLLSLCSATYLLVVSYFSVSNHFAFGSNAWDLGVYNQALYSALTRCRLFYHTVDLPGNPTGSFFGVHFSPIMFLLLPIYAIHPDPVTLLILRPVIVAIGAIPLYWIARDKLNSRFLIGLLVIGYFIYPPVLEASFNFDLEVFLIPLFLFSIYYMTKDNLPRAYAFLILALMVNEFVPFIVIAAGIYYLLSHSRSVVAEIGQRRLPRSLVFSAILILTGVLWWILATSTISYFNPTALNTKWEWGELGQDPRAIITTVLTNPSKAINALVSDGYRKTLYVSTLFGPLAFLSLLDPLTLIMSGPWLVASLLSIDPLYYAVGFQYAAFVSVFIFVSAINGAKRFARLSGWITKNLHHTIPVSDLLLVALTATVLLFPLAQTASVPDSPDIVRQSISMVPPEASVSAMPEFFPHFSNRLEAYPYYKKNVDFVLVDIYSWWYDVTLPRPTHTAPKWIEADIGSEYGIALNANGIILYEKGFNGEPFFVPTNLTFRCDDLKTCLGKIVTDKTSLSQNVLMYSQNESDGFFWLDSPRLLPLGAYKVTLRLKASSRTTDSLLLLNLVANNTAKIAEKEMSGQSLNKSGQWQSFTLDFSLNRPTSIQIIGSEVAKAADVYLDFIQILQTSGRR